MPFLSNNGSAAHGSIPVGRKPPDRRCVWIWMDGAIFFLLFFPYFFFVFELISTVPSTMPHRFFSHWWDSTSRWTKKVHFSSFFFSSMTSLFFSFFLLKRFADDFGFWFVIEIDWNSSPCGFSDKPRLQSGHGQRRNTVKLGKTQ